MYLPIFILRIQIVNSMLDQAFHTIESESAHGLEGQRDDRAGLFRLMRLLLGGQRVAYELNGSELATRDVVLAASEVDTVDLIDQVVVVVVVVVAGSGAACDLSDETAVPVVRAVHEHVVAESVRVVDERRAALEKRVDAVLVAHELLGVVAVMHVELVGALHVQNGHRRHRVDLQVELDGVRVHVVYRTLGHLTWHPLC